MIKLRAHHLLCVKDYNGSWGFSPEFIENMLSISSLLEREPETKFLLVESADDICGKCSYLSNGKCISESPPEVQDIMVLKYFGFEADKEYSYRTVLDIIQSKITRSVFDDICGDCDNIEICRKAWKIR